MYGWADVAMRTEKVYDGVYARENTPLINRLIKFYNAGSCAGLLFVLVIVTDFLILGVLEIFYPKRKIDLARKWPKKNKAKWGNQVTENGGTQSGEIDAFEKRNPYKLSCMLTK